MHYPPMPLEFHDKILLTPLLFGFSIFLSNPSELLEGFANRSNLAYFMPKYFKWLYFCILVQLVTELLSGDSSDLPPMYIDAIIMWVEFVVGSILCSERFFPGTPVFPFPLKPKFVNSHLTRNEVDKKPQHGCAPSKNFFIDFYSSVVYPWLFSVLLDLTIYCCLSSAFSLFKTIWWF